MADVHPVVWLFFRFVLACLVGIIALVYAILTVVTNSFNDLVCAVSESLAFMVLVW